MRDPFSLSFDFEWLRCLLGGVSALDIPRLDVRSLEEAEAFLKAYGFDWQEAADRQELWAIHKRAVALIQQEFLNEGGELPPELYSRQDLNDLRWLLLYASEPKPRDEVFRQWACAILRVMHVYVHLRFDLFSVFKDQIQTQVLRPIERNVIKDDHAGSTVLGFGQDYGDIRLAKFEKKLFKTTSSSVIKLLARPEKMALTLLDKLGVRFVTRSIFDSFRVVRYLSHHHLMSFAHIIPDQSNNTLYPLNIFYEVMQDLNNRKAQGEPISSLEIEQALSKAGEEKNQDIGFLRKENVFSAEDYKFIKFINRKLVSLDLFSSKSHSSNRFRFFYPFEIQIMDYNTYLKTLSGPMSHRAYKERQRKKGRDRALGIKEKL